MQIIVHTTLPHSTALALTLCILNDKKGEKSNLDRL
jgi:hypothetical protein